MANGTPSFSGQINGAGDNTALHLKVYSGETLAAFLRETVMLDKVMVKTITSGKSAQFPATGKVSTGIHTPGEELVGKTIKHAERVIPIDGLLISDVFIDVLDEAMATYDSRSIYTAEMASGLTNDIDDALLKEVVKAARATATVEGLPDGSTVVNADILNADSDIKANAIADSLFAAATILDENDARGTKCAVLTPDLYYTLVQSDKAVNRDFSGAGSYAKGEVLEVAGVMVYKSNNVPTTDTSISDPLHGVNAVKTAFVVFVSSAVGLVKLKDLSSESEYDIRRQGSLLVSKLAVGMGILRPEAAIEVAHTV